jgi:hypothetical protein
VAHRWDPSQVRLLQQDVHSQGAPLKPCQAAHRWISPQVTQEFSYGLPTYNYILNGIWKGVLDYFGSGLSMFTPVVMRCINFLQQFDGIYLKIIKLIDTWCNYTIFCVYY